jgi:integrase
MSIEQINSGKYRAIVYFKGSRLARSPAFELKKQAVAWETEQKQRICDGSFFEYLQDVQIKEALCEFAKEVKDCVKDHKRQVLRVIAEHIDTYKLESVSDFQPKNVLHFIRNSDLSAKTLSNYVGHLKQFGDFLFRNAYSDSNPMGSIKKPTVKRTKIITLSEAELKKIIHTAEELHPNSSKLFHFLILTGFRKMEAVTLQWNEVDLDNRVIRLRNKLHIIVNGAGFTCKHNSERDFPISEDLYKLLVSLNKSSSDFVFKNRKGQPFFNNLNRDLNSILEKIKSEESHEGELLNPSLNITIHSFRHAWISHAIENGLSIQAVSEYCGHRSASFTLSVYGHFVPKKDRMGQDSAKFLSLSE